MKATVTIELEVTTKSAQLTEEDLRGLLGNLCARVSHAGLSEVKLSREIEIQVEGLPPREVSLNQSASMSWEVHT